MDSTKAARGRTRREFLKGAIQLGLGAAAFGALGPVKVAPVFAQGGRPERVEVLLDEVVESTAADFSRGQARGVEIAAQAGTAALRGEPGGQFTSGVVKLPFQATHLGLHWVTGDAPPESVVLEVRSSADGAAWSEWREVTVEAVADLSAGKETFGALVDGKRSRYSQYRVNFSGGQTASVERVAVTAINSVDGPREPLAGVAAATATLSAPGASITAITREGWGCDESLRLRRKTEIWPEMYVPARKVVLHHTATANGYSDGAAEVRAIYTYHARTLGWGDIGYNALVDNRGNVYEGRHGRGEGADREILSASVVAGHVYSHNYGSTGVAYVGDSNEADITAAALPRVLDVITLECGRRGIDPKGASDFLRSDDTWHDSMNNISGHSESYNTDCPGTYLKERLAAIRTEVAGRLPGGTPTLSSDSPKGQAEPGTLTFKLPSTCQYYLEGWYKPSNSDDITYLSGYMTGGYNDPLAKVPQWTSSTDTSKTFSELAAGHYTIHVRTSGTAYEASMSFLVKKTATSKKPPRR